MKKKTDQGLLKLVQEVVTEWLDVRFGDRRLDKNMQEKLAAL